MSKKEKQDKKHKKKKKDQRRKWKRSQDEEATASAIGKHQQLSDSATVRVSLDTNIAAVAASQTTTSQNESKENNGWSWDTVFAAAATIEPVELDQDFLNRTAPSVNANDDEGGGGLAQISRLAAAAAATQQPVQVTTSKDPDSTSVPTKHSFDLHGESNNANKKPKGEKRRRSDGATVSSDNKTDQSLANRKIKESSNQFREHEKEADSKQQQEQETEEETVSLEGRMVPHPKRSDGEQIMVLVDPKRLAVYSALKRTCNDDLIRIGSLVEGDVVLDGGAVSSDEEEPDKNEDKTSLFPFPTDPDDHCESPIEAYQDILPLLNKLCETSSKSEDNLAIYDPYFCDGAVVRHLASLDFDNVHNKKQDCYKVWSTGVGYPNFDVLITNPPYSENHIPKLMQHVTHANFGDRPWFLLMPNWVHKKDYYKQAIDKANCRPFYLVPKKRYVYLPPKRFRDKKASDVHKKSSPFVSMWYIWGGNIAMTDKLIDHYYRAFGNNNDHPCDLARSRSALRDLRRKGKK